MKILNGIGVHHITGTLRIRGLKIDTSNTNSAGNKPVSVAANGCSLHNCIIVAPALAESIYAASAKNVGILGHCMANVAKHANVTLTPLGVFTVDSAVS